MNLLKLFNKNYLFQNLKKSKGLLALILGLIPIFSFAILFVNLTNNDNNIVATLENISTINFVGVFVIPVVLSVCLFGFAFKKKSVDFINSMPINRLSIFITNTVGGILLILAITMINCLLFILLSLLFSSFILIPGVLLDYFIVWSIFYIFVFIVANLAVVLSGNLITSIILVALGLFLVPFTYDYATNMLDISGNNHITIACNDESCKPREHFCYGDEVCEINKNLGIYDFNGIKTNDSNFTLPYGIIRNIFITEDDFEIYNPVSLLKMCLLSILYFIVGVLAFKKRKMENCETSFQSIHTHLIVKCLTMTPMIILFIEIIRNSASDIYILIFAIILIAYYFIYDLITKKGLQKFGLSLGYFLGFILLIFAFTTIVHQKHNQNLTINVENIESVAIERYSYDNTSKNEILNNIFINNKELINLIIKESLEENNMYMYQPSFNIKLADGTVYRLEVFLNEESYNEIMNYFYQDEKVLKTIKNINIDKAIAIKIGSFVLKVDNYRNLLELVKEEMSSLDLKEYFSRDYFTDEVKITYYTYENHEVKSYTVLTEFSEKLNNYLANFYNEKIQSLKMSDNIYFQSLKYYPEVEMYYEQELYLMNAEIEDTLKLIKDLTKGSFDITKPYINVYMMYNGYYYTMYTNEIEKFEEYLDILREKYKNNSEYQSIIRPFDFAEEK